MNKRHDPGVLGNSNAMADLAELARGMGAANAAFIATAEIRVADDLASLCRKPGCENYGLSANCPPHVAGPDGFRQLLKCFRLAMVFKMTVPANKLLSDERDAVFRTLQETAAFLEQEAVKMGWPNARAYAGGACKRVFCEELDECRMLAEGGPCRYPHQARPSMSGFGIDVGALMASAGWPLVRVTAQTAEHEGAMGDICALVLLG